VIILPYMRSELLAMVNLLILVFWVVTRRGLGASVSTRRWHLRDKSTQRHNQHLPLQASWIFDNVA
jgi:hypothetical protein